jgi:hypothetical protein
MPQHSLQRHTGQRARLRMHPNHIRRTPLRNAIEHPEQVLLVNAVHGCAQALAVRKNAHKDVTLRGSLCDPVH